MSRKRIFPLDVLTTNRRRQALGNEIYKDSLIDTRGLRQEVVTGHKPWSLCARFMCRHPTASGRREKNIAKRLCRFHSPEGIARREKNLTEGRWRRAPCRRDPELPCCGRPLSPQATCRKVQGSCTHPRKISPSNADWYYAHHDYGECRTSVARWRWKTAAWRFGDPPPPDLWDGEEA